MVFIHFSDTFRGIMEKLTVRLVCVRATTIVLSLIVFTVIILSGLFPEWFFSETFEVHIHTEYKQHNASDYIEDNIINLYDLRSTDDVQAACVFPKINPVEHSVMKKSGLHKTTLHCEGTFLPDLTYITEGNELKVNRSLLEKYFNIHDFEHCRYRHVFRHDTDDNNYQYSDWSDPFTDKIELADSAEFIKVECINSRLKVLSKTFYGLIPRHEELNEADSLNFHKRQAMSAPKETLNIIMIGMDTLFRHQFLRGCNKAYSYLMNTLKSFDLTMHSQLGENTFPNFLPLFVGQSYEEVTKWWSEKEHLDTLDMLWGNFEKAGYRTLFAEDWPEFGGFHYLKKGFRKKFARYNTRAISLAMYGEKELFQHHKYCAGNQLEMTFLLEYVSRFLDTFRDKPVFSVAVITKPTHGDPTDARMVDQHLLKFYQSLNEKGHLNRSVLVSFSDHGVRWGPLLSTKNGHFESRTPYTILTFPDWFLRKYPDVAANLKVNTKRLTTHFDTHATLLDLLYFKSNTPPPLAPLRHGISILKKIPWDRTCTDASIPIEYCLCGYKGLGEIDASAQESKVLANLVVDVINSKTDKNICAVFTLHQITSMEKIALRENNPQGKHEQTVYKIKLETIPGNAVFEATVYAEANSTALKVAHDIHRLNLYRGQAECLNISTLRPFCYCNHFLSN